MVYIPIMAQNIGRYIGIIGGFYYKNSIHHTILITGRSSNSTMGKIAHFA